VRAPYNLDEHEQSSRIAQFMQMRKASKQLVRTEKNYCTFITALALMVHLLQLMNDVNGAKQARKRSPPPSPQRSVRQYSIPGSIHRSWPPVRTYALAMLSCGAV
jgi:hypothetical protein